MVGSLETIGAEDTEIAMTKRLQDKYQKNPHVWPKVGPYLFAHNLRSVFWAMYQLGWCKKPATDFGFVQLDEASLLATDGYQKENWNGLPVDVREFLVTKGHENLGLNACELRELHLLQHLLEIHGITDANK